jgi:hypothetical protein
VIRNVCIHVTNEQPLMCDLFALPSASDAGLVCTNVRSMDGKRPVFIDASGSTFFFPYHVVRFLEIPEQSMAAYRAAGGRLATDAVALPADDAMTDAAGWPAHNGGAARDAAMDQLLPVVLGAPPAADDDPDVDLEIDEDFLKRVRDI